MDPTEVSRRLALGVYAAIETWRPAMTRLEYGFQAALAQRLRTLDPAPYLIEMEKRVQGSVVDVYVQTGAQLSLTRDVVIELKANLTKRAECLRAENQVIRLITLGAQHIVVLVCGLSNIDLVQNLYAKLRAYVAADRLRIIVKPPAHLTMISEAGTEICRVDDPLLPQPAHVEHVPVRRGANVQLEVAFMDLLTRWIATNGDREVQSSGLLQELKELGKQTQQVSATCLNVWTLGKALNTISAQELLGIRRRRGQGVAWRYRFDPTLIDLVRIRLKLTTLTPSTGIHDAST